MDLVIYLEPLDIVLEKRKNKMRSISERILCMNNIVLIGMPGAGKSTIGVILAKVLGYRFIDTDLLIQQQENRLLKDIIETEGLTNFLDIEGEVIKNLVTDYSVIATGGSVIYRQAAMEHLKNHGILVYIRLNYGTINSRLGNIRSRGVVLKDGQSLYSLYEERCPLYEQYADIIMDAEGLTMEELMEQIKDEVQKFRNSKEKR